MGVDLDKLQALHAATTPGEWIGNYNDENEVAVDKHTPVAWFQFGGQGQSDSEFTAAIHNAFPVLVEELEHLREHKRWNEAVREIATCKETTNEKTD